MANARPPGTMSASALAIATDTRLRVVRILSSSPVHRPPGGFHTENACPVRALGGSRPPRSTARGPDGTLSGQGIHPSPSSVNTFAPPCQQTDLHHAIPADLTQRGGAPA